MDFSLTEEHKMIQDTARDFADKELVPIAEEVDESREAPLEIVKKLGELGFMGMMVPEQYGGAELDDISYVLAMEEISRGCATTGVIMDVNNSLVCEPLNMYANDEQKKRVLTPLAQGELLGAYCLTEPEAGSDPSNIKMTAVEDGDDYILNGTKIFVTNGGFANIFIVFAKTDVEKGSRGLSAFIVEGQGFKIAMEALDSGRIGIASQAIGIARAAFDRALEYSKTRKQFGREICNFQAIQWKLADMATKIESAHLLTMRAAWLRVSGGDYVQASAMAKLFAGRVAVEVADEAIQVHGGYGYVQDYHVERHYRDAKITELYEGTSEVQRLIIARRLIRG